MLNCREQIKDLLSSVCDNVRMSKPDGKMNLPLICYAQTKNEIVNVGYDRLAWRVAVYSNTMDELLELVDNVNEKMMELGFSRTSITSDEEARKGTDLYMKRIDFSALVNKKHNTVVKGSV